ncbi:glycosyltransferase family 2 protein [soil metagenome]
MSRPVTLSAVVPVFNEVESLPAFHDELIQVLADLDLPAEVVYVDDGSTDGSTEVLEKLQADQPDVVRVVVLRRNFGKSGALAAGFEVAVGELIVTLDADGQDVPDQLPLMLEHLGAAELDLVGGWRASRIDRRVKRWTSRMYNAATRTFTGLDLHDFNTGYKLMRREVVDELPLYGEFHRFVPVLAHDLGFRVGEVAVDHRPRQAGTSKYLSVLRFPKTLLDLLTVLFLTRFADRPLYLFGGVGAALSVAGFVILTYLSVLRLFFGQGIGTRPLLLFGVLCFLVGVQLVGTGFIGDILRHSNASRQIPYRIRRVVGVTDPAPERTPDPIPPDALAPDHTARDRREGREGP